MAFGWLLGSVKGANALDWHNSYQYGSIQNPLIGVGWGWRWRRNNWNKKTSRCIG